MIDPVTIAVFGSYVLAGAAAFARRTLAPASYCYRQQNDQPIIPMVFEHQLPMPVAPTPKPQINSEPPRYRTPHYEAPKKAVVSVAKACDLLIEWMNAEGHTGVFSASEIDEFWAVTTEMCDLVEIDCRFIREALEGKGLRIGQKRLNTPEYLHVKQRTGKSRLVLYRIPRCRGVVGTEPSKADGNPASPARSRNGSGTDPAINQKSSENISVREAA